MRSLSRSKWFAYFYSVALGAEPSLILHNFFVGPTPTPSYIRANKDYLDTLPFDGLTVYVATADLKVNVTAYVYRPMPMSYSLMSSVLAPIEDLQMRSLKQNFALMFAGPGISMFDDSAWGARLENLRSFARAIRSAGLQGIFFDNENYEDWAHYGGKGCSMAYTLKACQQQARLRGFEIMRALVSGFPDIVVLSFYGPWVSDSTFYERQRTYNNVAQANELSGPFFVGMVEGAMGSPAKVVDGGEFYLSRTKQDFLDRYRYQKFAIASDTGVPDDRRSRAAGPNGFIPAELRSKWYSFVSVGAGLYDIGQADATGRDLPITPDILRKTITNALTTVDQFAWFYPESMTFLEPPGTSRLSANSVWIRAIREGKLAAADGQ